MKLNANKIKMLLAERGLAQYELAEISGVSRQTVSSMLQKGSCHPDTLLKISRALDVDPQELIGKEG